MDQHPQARVPMEGVLVIGRVFGEYVTSKLLNVSKEMAIRCRPMTVHRDDITTRWHASGRADLSP